MADDQTQDRTESATPRRREEARERGQVAMSNDVAQAVLLLSGILGMWFLSHRLAYYLVDLARRELYSLADRQFTIQTTAIMVQALLSRAAAAFLPLLGILLIVAVAINLGQAGLRITTRPLAFNWSRLSLGKGFGKIFSLRAAMRGVMMLSKLGLGIGGIAGYIWSHRTSVVQLGHHSLENTVALTWTASLKMCLALAGTLLAIGLIDYLFQRWQHEQDLKMSRQDIKDEYKREEGDPQLKGHRRKQAREAAKLQMLRAVPQASVVLTNPTHIAVALKYDRQEMDAPQVIAKGTDLFAKRIAAVARENGIPVLERKPLARALYASVEVNQEIPPNLYRAVAEILAHLYGLRKAS